MAVHAGADGAAAFARAVVDDVWDVLESVMPMEVE
jgi:hypothetical protein